MSEVISLKDFRKKKEEGVPVEESSSDSKNSEKQQDVEEKQEDFDFEAIVRANKEKADKLTREREKSNKGVKRSYNLRPDDPNNRRR